MQNFMSSSELKRCESLHVTSKFTNIVTDGRNQVFFVELGKINGEIILIFFLNWQTEQSNLLIVIEISSFT